MVSLMPSTENSGKHTVSVSHHHHDSCKFRQPSGQTGPLEDPCVPPPDFRVLVFFTAQPWRGLMRGVGAAYWKALPRTKL